MDWSNVDRDPWGNVDEFDSLCRVSVMVVVVVDDDIKELVEGSGAVELEEYDKVDSKGGPEVTESWVDSSAPFSSPASGRGPTVSDSAAVVSVTEGST